MSAAQHELVLDPFVIRQFDDTEYTGTRFDYNKAEFEAKVNEYYKSGNCPLVDGYAPFCKHIFVPNFVGDSIRVPYLEITPENEDKLRSGYDARREEELAVLVRWFPADSAPEPAVAEYLDVILYSREQIRKEAAALGCTESGAAWRPIPAANESPAAATHTRTSRGVIMFFSRAHKITEKATC